MTQERQAELKAIRDKLSNLSDKEKSALTARGLIATVEGRTLSRYNTFMVYLQSRQTIPSVVGGYRQWKRAGRQVLKGQHGSSILIPIGVQDKETGDIAEVTTFYSATVFDISQTEEISEPVTA